MSVRSVPAPLQSRSLGAERPASTRNADERPLRRTIALPLLALALPPAALAFVGRPGSGAVALLLMNTLIGRPIAAVWALISVHARRRS